MLGRIASTRPLRHRAPSGQEVTRAGDELTWPREFQDNGTKVDIYQPQIEKWEGADFETRSAAAITLPGGSNAPVYGVFWMKAGQMWIRRRDRHAQHIEVTRVKFPSVPALQNEYLALIRKHVPTVSKTCGAGTCRSQLCVSEAVKKSRTVAVKNDPPRVLYSAVPHCCAD